jgi:AAA15 family ATPase/GTPase
MLLSFSVENHLSFRDLETFSLAASSDQRHEAFSVVETQKERVLSVAAVYGANASGKSNLIDSMNWLREAVLAPVSQSVREPQIPVDPFLLRKGNEQRPSFFEIEFLWKNHRYRYGLQVTREKVEAEYLFRKRPGIKEANLFTREGQDIQPSPTQFKEGKGLETRTKATSLFLTVCAAFNVAEAETVVEWFRQFRFVSGLDDMGLFHFTAEQIQKKPMRDRILRFSQKADFNISGLESDYEEVSKDNAPEDLPKHLQHHLAAGKNLIRAEIRTSHPQFDANGKIVGQVTWDLLKKDSEGTQKFIALAGPILHTLNQGSVLVIDEFEARLHPALTSAIIDWFQGPANRNKAQLIITTHDVNLMTPEHLRRDQIWLVTKDPTGHSSLARLSEFDVNQVKPTSRFNKHYMMGLYGAFPRVAIDEFLPTE